MKNINEFHDLVFGIVLMIEGLGAEVYRFRVVNQILGFKSTGRENMELKVSRSLQSLKKKGLVRCDRRGRWKAVSNTTSI